MADVQTLTAALETALHDLSALHGLMVYDDGKTNDRSEHWRLDTKQTCEALRKALSDDTD